MKKLIKRLIQWAFASHLKELAEDMDATTKPYNVLYQTGQYLTYELTKSDYRKLQQALCQRRIPFAVETSTGIVGLNSILSITECDLKQPAPQATESGEPVLDDEITQFLREHEKYDDVDEEDGLDA